MSIAKKNESWFYDSAAGALLRRVLVITSVLVIAFFLLFPIYWIVVTSLKTTGEIQAIPPTVFPETFSFEGYQRSFDRKPFEQYIFNSLVISISASILAIAVGTPAAYAFSRRKFSAKGVFMSLLLASLMFPGAAIMVPVWELMDAIHLHNNRFALVLLYAAMTAPFVVWLMKGFFDDFPESLLDAAKIDQCSPYEQFRYVVAPMAKSPIIASFIFCFLLAWNELVFALVLLANEHKYTVPVGLLSFLTGFNVQWNHAMAASIVVSIPVLLGLTYIQKYIAQGITGGAVKK
ncbi:carbohydrate ABC transporter permease [Natrarchaeobius sp. A-rgal3]|uniref:carbohydrate ABC transporter permease n=1 Tax=Natrarchaeobius versutus TaxID=1679078 RepID=UPI00350FEB3B